MYEQYTLNYVVLALLKSGSWKTLGEGSMTQCQKIMKKHVKEHSNKYHAIMIVEEDKVEQTKRNI